MRQQWGEAIRRYWGEDKAVVEEASVRWDEVRKGGKVIRDGWREK